MENSLTHYGILGMKWGVRRTEAQLARARGKSKSSSADNEVKESRKTNLKNRRILSTTDLKNGIERLKLEKQFKDLTSEDISPGKKMASDILKSSGKKVLTTAAAGTFAYVVKAAMTKKFDLKEAANYVAANPNKKK